MAIGDRYRISWVVESTDASGVRFFLDNLNGYTSYQTSLGAGTAIVTATSSTSFIASRAGLNEGSSISYYSVKKILSLGLP